MAGLKIIKIIKIKKLKEIIHDANDVCKSGDIPSWLGNFENYQSAADKQLKDERQFNLEKMLESD